MACEAEQEALDNANSAASTLADEILQLESDISDLTTTIDAATDERTTKQTELNNKQTQLGTLENETIPALQTDLNNCLNQ